MDKHGNQVSFGRSLFVKVALFDALVLAVLVAVSLFLTYSYKARLAEQLAEAYRAPLLAGDGRQIMLDMSRPVEKDFLGMMWAPAGGGYSFSIPADAGISRQRLSGISIVKVYFDEQRKVEAGSLRFYYFRWQYLPEIFVLWFLLVFLSGLIGKQEWRRLEREHRLTIESKVNENLAYMAAQVAHDIRSPLAALDSALKDLAALPAEKQELARGAVGRIGEIAQDLLEKYKKPGTKAEPAEKTISAQELKALIEPVLAEKRAQYSTRPEVAIDFSCAEGARAKVHPAELRRIVSNLVNNAVEAFEKGGRVAVELSRLDGHVLLKVSDNGKGIPAGILAKLGQKGETHGKAGGTGLGLFHARTTVESWGGSLKIKSMPCSGTAVTIELPAIEPEAAPKAAVLIDDDALVRLNWKTAARAKGVALQAFASPSDFYSAESGLAKDSHVYIDSELGNGVKGEELAQTLKDKGYTNICLETGHSPENFSLIPWLKIAGKEPPWA